MAPSVGRKGNQVAVKTPTIAARPQGSSPQVMSGTAMPPEALQMMQKLAKMQAEALTKSRWVGESFAEDSRAMHYGEREAEQIHGQATIKEARDLIDEGIAVAHLPFPIAPPGEAN